MRCTAEFRWTTSARATKLQRKSKTYSIVKTEWELETRAKRKHILLCALFLRSLAFFKRIRIYEFASAPLTIDTKETTMNAFIACNKPHNVIKSIRHVHLSRATDFMCARMNLLNRSHVSHTNLELSLSAPVACVCWTRFFTAHDISRAVGRRWKICTASATQCHLACRFRPVRTITATWVTCILIECNEFVHLHFLGCLFFCCRNLHMCSGGFALDRWKAGNRSREEISHESNVINIVDPLRCCVQTIFRPIFFVFCFAWLLLVSISPPTFIEHVHSFPFADLLKLITSCLLARLASFLPNGHFSLFTESILKSRLHDLPYISWINLALARSIEPTHRARRKNNHGNRWNDCLRLPKFKATVISNSSPLPPSQQLWIQFRQRIGTANG